MKRLFILLLPLLLSGCMTMGPLYAPPPIPDPPYARLIIYRQPGLAGAAWAHSYYVDGRLVAELRVNNYTYVFVKEGEREVHYGANANYRGQLLKVSMRAGETYYFREGRTMEKTTITPMGTGSLINVAWTDRVQLVGKDQAEAELPSYQFLKPVLSTID